LLIIFLNLSKFSLSTNKHEKSRCPVSLFDNRNKTKIFQADINWSVISEKSLFFIKEKIVRMALPSDGE
jgi:hypothetical protein